MDFRTLPHFLILDGPGIRSANRGDSHESMRANRFAEKKNLFLHNVSSDLRIAPTVRSTSCNASKWYSQQKGFNWGVPQAIRENQAIRANLRIDSRESGH